MNPNQTNNQTMTADGLNADLKPITVADNTSPSMASFISDLEAKMKTLQDQQDPLSQELMAALNPGTAQAQAEAEQASGLTDVRSRLADLGGQVNAIDAQLVGERAGAQNAARGTLETTSFLNTRMQNLAEQAAMQKAPLLIEQAILSGREDTAARTVETFMKIKGEQDKARLEAAKFNLERNYDLFDTTDKRVADAKLAEIESEQKKIDKFNDLRQEMSTTLLSNGAPTSFIQKLLTSNSQDELLTTPGIEKYMQSPLEKAQLAKLWADIEEANNIASPGLSEKERQALLGSEVGQQAITMVSLQEALKEYQKRVVAEGGIISPKKRKELNSFLTQVIAPTLAVANEQGAMTDDERDQILKDLGVSGLSKRESVTQANIESTLQGNDIKLQSIFDGIDSSYPGATDSYMLFKAYKDSNLTDDEFFATQTDALSPNDYFNF